MEQMLHDFNYAERDGGGAFGTLSLAVGDGFGGGADLVFVAIEVERSGDGSFGAGRDLADGERFACREAGEVDTPEGSGDSGRSSVGGSHGSGKRSETAVGVFEGDGRLVIDAGRGERGARVDRRAIEAEIEVGKMERIDSQIGEGPAAERRGRKAFFVGNGEGESCLEKA